MNRNTGHKRSFALETLESRNLQSGITTDGALIATPQNPVLISGNPAQYQANTGFHNYHAVTGFFGQ